MGETILVFPQHRVLLGGWGALHDRLQALGGIVAEKAVVVEAMDLAEAELAIAAGAQVVQFDKAPPELLTLWCAQLRSRHPHIHLLAAGGIHPDNAAGFAATGEDALVTSSPHSAAPADVGVLIKPC